MIGAEGCAEPLVEALLDRAIAGVAAEGVGVMARARNDTRDYVTQRRQFGRTLGEFQAVQHRLVDMFVEWERAVAACCLATLRLDDAPTARAKAASSAKVTLGKALRFVGQNAVQLHGEMGMTDDLAVGHAFKQMTIIDGEFGTIDHHLARYARLSHLQSADSSHTICDMPLTLLHADCHIKNWYVRRDDGVIALADWQNVVYGNWGRDISYLLSTSLTVEQRREWEVDLMRYYLDRLREKGVDTPSFEEAWDIYRKNFMSVLVY